MWVITLRLSKQLHIEPQNKQILNSKELLNIVRTRNISTLLYAFVPWCSKHESLTDNLKYESNLAVLSS